jgi:hypothetical protein
MVDTMLTFTFLNVNSIDIREEKGYLLELRLVKQAWVRMFSSWYRYPFLPPPLFIAQVQPAFAHALGTSYTFFKRMGRPAIHNRHLAGI